MQPFLRLSNQRLPPSDLHVQQAQNSPRLMSVNLLPACPRTLNDWRYSWLENKSIKAQYPKSIERKRRVKNARSWPLFLVSFWLPILRIVQVLSVSFLCNVCFLFIRFLVWQSVNYYNPKKVCHKLWRTILNFKCKINQKSWQ